MKLIKWHREINHSFVTGFKLLTKHEEDELVAWNKPLRVYYGTKYLGELSPTSSYYVDYNSGKEFLEDPKLKITELNDEEADVIITNIGIGLHSYWYSFDQE